MNCYQRYADLIKTTWTWAFYELERNFDMNEIWVLARWKPWFSLKFLNRRISKILRCSIWYAPIKNLWETFVKTLTVSKIQACCLCFYWMRVYWTNIYQWYFYTNWSIHPEVFYTSTLNCMTKLGNDLLFHKVICVQVLIERLCLLTKSMSQKQKRLFQSLWMIAFWPLLLG